MTSPDYITIAVWVLGGLFSIIGVLFAAGVRQMTNKVDSIAEQLGEINKTLIGIERDLRGELAGLDRRLTRIETRCDGEHGK